jgi:hypothetical protein
VSLAEVTRSLEDVYLGIVDQHTPVEQQQASTSLSPRVSSVTQVNEQQESIS